MLNPFRRRFNRTMRSLGFQTQRIQTFCMIYSGNWMLIRSTQSMRSWKFRSWSSAVRKKTTKTQEKLNAILDVAVERYKNELQKERQDDFKSTGMKFIRTYSFVLQIAPFIDVELHKLYVYLNYLLKKLPKNQSEAVYLADEIALEYYRNTMVFEGSISLEVQGGAELNPTSHGGGGGKEEPTD